MRKRAYGNGAIFGPDSIAAKRTKHILRGSDRLTLGEMLRVAYVQGCEDAMGAIEQGGGDIDACLALGLIGEEAAESAPRGTTQGDGR